MKQTRFYTLALLAALALAACQPVTRPPAAVAPAVALPTVTPSPPPGNEAVQATADIVDTAIAADNLTVLVSTIEAAGLVETLKGEGPFTLFAPTDEAFAKLPAGTIDTLLADPSGQLAQILLYHVVPGKLLAADISDGLEATTAEGAPIAFRVNADGLMIGDAKILTTDIEAANGVIHLIDTVLMPPATGDMGSTETITGSEEITSTESTTDTSAVPAPRTQANMIARPTISS